MAVQKYKDADGNWQKLNVKVTDTLPLGSIVEYNGATAPDGWEEVEDEGEVYSTEEQVIGKWINGKPIYRKVIIASNISSGSNLIDIPTNIEEIVNFNVISHRDNNIIKNNQVIQEGFRQLVTPDLTNNKIEIYIEGINIQYSHITLKYTKTTDTANVINDEPLSEEA